MVEYYKLSLLIKKDRGAGWEEVYLEINGDKSKILVTYPSVLTGMLRHKLEKMTEEDVKKLLDSLNRDTGCVSIH